MTRHLQHGGDLSEAMARYGGRLEDWLDLSTGINPWPYEMPALPATCWHRLPSRDDEAALIEAARKAYGVPDGAAIVAGPGTQALIQWLPRLAAPGAVAIATLTYGEHAAAWSLAGHVVVTPGADAVHRVCVNPNNPDGRVTGSGLLLDAAIAAKARGGWLVVDESFADLDPAVSIVARCADLPIVVLRSFGKFFGLAGLRLGFAIAPPAIAARLAAALGPWAVAGPALAIGRAALADADWARQMRERLKRQAAELDALLVPRGLEIIGGTDLFRLARCHRAAELREALAARHIWVRRFEDAATHLRFGLPGAPAAVARLAAALQRP